MKVPVSRVTMTKWKDIVAKFAGEASFVEIPGILPNGDETHAIKFRGVYSDNLKHEIAVAWPIDRPHEAQVVFANEHCFGAFPAEVYQKVIRPSGLSLVKGDA